MKQTIFFCVLIFSLQAGAQEAPDYYRATVPVKSQSANDRKFAAQKGLQEVLVRMSASEKVLVSETVQAAVSRAQSFLEQYQFRVVTDAALKQKGYREEMQLEFSSEMIQQLLNKANIRFWPEGNRPKILVWLVEDEAQYGKQLLNADSLTVEGDANPLVLAINKAARERGLPLEYPLLDLDDQMAISAEDVWRLREDKIRAAADRYSASVILVGRYSTTSRGEYWSTWQYYHQTFNQTWDSRAKDIDTFASEALAPLNEFLADRYSILPRAPGDTSALILHLAGVNSFKQFRQALDYLNGLAMISDVNVLEVQNGELMVGLQSEANLERFKSAVQLDKKIKFLPQQSELPEWQLLPEGTRENPAHYQWLGT